MISFPEIRDLDAHNMSTRSTMIKIVLNNSCLSMMRFALFLTMEAKVYQVTGMTLNSTTDTMECAYFSIFFNSKKPQVHKSGVIAARCKRWPWRSRPHAGVRKNENNSKDRILYTALSG